MCDGYVHTKVESEKDEMNRLLLSLFKDGFEDGHAVPILKRLVSKFDNIQDPTENPKTMEIMKQVFGFVSKILGLMSFFETIAKEDVHNDVDCKCKFHDGDTLLMHLVLACIGMVNLEKNPEFKFIAGYLGLIHDIGKLKTKSYSSWGIGFTGHGEIGAIELLQIYKKNKSVFDSKLGKYNDVVIDITANHMHHYPSKEHSIDDDNRMRIMNNWFSLMGKRLSLNELEEANAKNLFLNMFVSDNSAKKPHEDVKHIATFQESAHIQKQKERLGEILDTRGPFENSTCVFNNYTHGLRKLRKLAKKLGYKSIMIVDDNLLAKNTFTLEDYKDKNCAIILNTPKLVLDRDSLYSIFENNQYPSYNVFGTHNIFDTLGYPKGEIKYICGKYVKHKDCIQGESVIIV
jgi:hypothetical protein